MPRNPYNEIRTTARAAVTTFWGCTVGDDEAWARCETVLRGLALDRETMAQLIRWLPVDTTKEVGERVKTARDRLGSLLEEI